MGIQTLEGLLGFTGGRRLDIRQSILQDDSTVHAFFSGSILMFLTLWIQTLSEKVRLTFQIIVNYTPNTS